MNKNENVGQTQMRNQLRDGARRRKGSRNEEGEKWVGKRETQRVFRERCEKIVSSVLYSVEVRNASFHVVSLSKFLEFLSLE